MAAYNDTGKSHHGNGGSVHWSADRRRKHSEGAKRMWAKRRAEKAAAAKISERVAPLLVAEGVVVGKHPVKRGPDKKQRVKRNARKQSVLSKLGFSGLLIVAREIRNVTQAELAHSAGLSASQVAQYELGNISPKFGDVIKLAEALGLSINTVGKALD